MKKEIISKVENENGGFDYSSESVEMGPEEELSEFEKMFPHIFKMLKEKGLL